MRATETLILASNVAAIADTDGSVCLGGRYMVFTHGTLGTAALEVYCKDDGNWHAVNDLATDGAVVELPSGRVRANISGGSGAYVTISRVPAE